MGMPARTRLFSSFRTLIKYAKPTELWNICLSKLSNKDHSSSFVTKSVGVFLVFIFCVRKWNNLTFGGWKKREEAGPKKKTIVTMFVEFAR